MRITTMDDKDYITRYEYDERQKRIDDENNRQNHRIDKLEKIADQLTDMAASIKAMVVTMQSMQKEQERQGERLDDIERKPSAAPVKHAMKSVGCDLGVFVGDSEVDILTAKSFLSRFAFRIKQRWNIG